MADATAPGSTPEQASSPGELPAAVSRSLVQLHKECYGKGPTKARTYASEDLLVCILEGGFTKGEKRYATTATRMPSRTSASSSRRCSGSGSSRPSRDWSVARS